MAAALHRHFRRHYGHHLLAGAACAPDRAPVFQTLSAMARAHKYATDDEVRRVAEQVWAHCRAEATEQLLPSAVSRVFGERDVLAYSSYTDALGSLLARKLHTAVAGPSHAGTPAGTREELEALRATMTEILSRPATLRAIIADLACGITTDPAIQLLLQPVFFHKGPLAVATHRCAHALWRQQDRAGALLLHSAASQTWGVDIHPAAQLGDGIYIDHGTGVVIGATAVVGSNVQLMHSVTLGSTGRSTPGAKRHPTVGSHTSLGCGATVLGDITIGEGAVVAAQAVVTRNVPAGASLCLPGVPFFGERIPVFLGGPVPHRIRCSISPLSPPCLVERARALTPRPFRPHSFHPPATHFRLGAPPPRRCHHRSQPHAPCEASRRRHAVERAAAVFADVPHRDGDRGCRHRPGNLAVGGGAAHRHPRLVQPESHAGDAAML